MRKEDSWMDDNENKEEINVDFYKKEEVSEAPENPVSSAMDEPENRMEYADISSGKKSGPEGKEKIVAFFKSKKGKIITAAVVILLALIVASVLLINGYLNKVGETKKYTATNDGNTSDILEDENYPLIHETPSSELNGTLQSMIKAFYDNGQPISSKNVINILLVGQDNSNIEVNSRADAMMLVSLNKRTKKITMVSLLRDQYMYINRNKNPLYYKFNSAESYGGSELLIKTFEQHYKIGIDNYVVVNFDTFPKIIDLLGGVELNLTAEEAAYLGTRFNVKTEPGKHIYTGEQALCYSRIRKLNSKDTDVKRVGRQRTVMTAVMKKFSDASISDMNKIVNQVLPYVKTGLTKGDIISLGTQAITKGWLKYEVSQFISPESDEVKHSRYIKAQYSWDEWFWVVDFPRAAQELQTELYGKTNIVLAENRPDYLKLSTPSWNKSSSGSGKTPTKKHDPDYESEDPYNQYSEKSEKETTTKPTTATTTRPSATADPPSTPEEEGKSTSENYTGGTTDSSKE